MHLHTLKIIPILFTHSHLSYSQSHTHTHTHTHTHSSRSPPLVLCGPARKSGWGLTEADGHQSLDGGEDRTAKGAVLHVLMSWGRNPSGSGVRVTIVKDINIY